MKLFCLYQTLNQAKYNKDKYIPSISRSKNCETLFTKNITILIFKKHRRMLKVSFLDDPDFVYFIVLFFVTSLYVK